MKGADFLFADAGHNLLVADTLLSGGVLYRDVFYPYGPLSAYLYAVVAGVFGNIPDVYLALLAAISAANVWLAYRLVRRAARPPIAISISVGLLALLPIPGAIAGAFTASPYVVIERTLLLLAALLWVPPSIRGARSSAMLGGLLGVWQGVKFGGAFFAGCAVLALDALYLAGAARSPSALRNWLRSLVVILASFLLVELGWMMYAWVTLPAEMAADVIWPLYMFQAYSVVTPDIRWPTWAGWRLMVGQYLLPLTAGALGMYGVLLWIKGQRTAAPVEAREARAGAVFVPLFFFAIASFGYFQHVYHFQQFLWALVPPAAWVLQRRGRWTLAIATSLAWVPGVLLVFRSAFFSVLPTEIVRVELPVGGTLAVTERAAERLTLLQRFVESDPTRQPLLFVPCGSGWHYSYRVPRSSRHTWFFAPETIRPYERHEFLRAFNRVRAVIACDDGARPQSPISSLFPLDQSLAGEIYGRLEPLISVAECRIYRLRDPGIAWRALPSTRPNAGGGPTQCEANRNGARPCSAPEKDACPTAGPSSVPVRALCREDAR